MSVKKLLILLSTTAVAFAAQNFVIQNLRNVGPFDQAVDVFSSANSTTITIPIDGAPTKLLTIGTNVTARLVTHGITPVANEARLVNVLVRNTNANEITWQVDEGTLAWAGSAPVTTNEFQSFMFSYYGGVVIGQSSSAASTESSPAVWTNLPSTVDMEGGTVYGSSLLNPNADGTVKVAVNYLTNFWGDISTLVAIGEYTFDPMELGRYSASLYAFGSSALQNVNLTNSYEVYAFGNRSMHDVTLANVADSYAFGYANLANATFDTTDIVIGIGRDVFSNFGGMSQSSYMFGLGHDVLSGTFFSGFSVVDSHEVYGIGHQSLSTGNLTNCHEVYAIGFKAGYGLSGSYTNVYLIGDNSQPTRAADQMVFGSSGAINYQFPGTDGAVFGGTVGSDVGFKFGALAGITVTNAWSDGGGTNWTQIISGGIITSMTHNP